MLLPVPIENISKKSIANKPRLYYNFKYNEGQLQLDFILNFVAYWRTLIVFGDTKYFSQSPFYIISSYLSRNSFNTYLIFLLLRYSIGYL